MLAKKAVNSSFQAGEVVGQQQIGAGTGCAGLIGGPGSSSASEQGVVEGSARPP
jgi:hypothetical protein